MKRITRAILSLLLCVTFATPAFAKSSHWRARTPSILRTPYHSSPLARYLYQTLVDRVAQHLFGEDWAYECEDDTQPEPEPPTPPEPEPETKTFEESFEPHNFKDKDYHDFTITNLSDQPIEVWLDLNEMASERQQAQFKISVLGGRTQKLSYKYQFSDEDSAFFLMTKVRVVIPTNAKRTDLNSSAPKSVLIRIERENQYTRDSPAGSKKDGNSGTLACSLRGCRLENGGGTGHNWGPDY